MNCLEDKRMGKQLAFITIPITVLAAKPAKRPAKIKISWLSASAGARLIILKQRIKTMAGKWTGIFRGPACIASSRLARPCARSKPSGKDRKTGLWCRIGKNVLAAALAFTSALIKRSLLATRQSKQANAIYVLTSCGKAKNRPAYAVVRYRC